MRKAASARVDRQRIGRAGETDTQNLNKRSYNNNTQNQSIHLRGRRGQEALDQSRKQAVLRPATSLRMQVHRVHRVPACALCLADRKSVV